MILSEILGCLAATRFAPAEAIGQLHAKLNFDSGARHPQGLQVGIRGDEFDVFHAGIDHAVDGIVATASDADHFDAGIIAEFFVEADTERIVVVGHIYTSKSDC